MGNIERMYYGATDVGFGLFLFVNSGLIGGGYADIVALIMIARGGMTLSKVFLIG